MLHSDSYYKDHSHLSLNERSRINFDHPDSIEFDLLYSDLQRLIKGEAIEQPTYDFALSSRKKETIRMAAVKALLLEGILLFYDKRIRDLCNVKVFVDTGPDERVLRIIKRDMEERGRVIEEVMERYEVVKNMHTEFIEPSRRYADIIIPKGGNNDVAIEIVAAYMKTVRS